MPAHCPNCLNDCTSLRILSCLHVFCDNCVDEFVKTSLPDLRNKLLSPTDTKWEPVIIICPDCRQETLVKEGGVSSLPMDPFSQNGEKTQEGTATNVYLCSSCQTGEKAISKCLDCDASLCSKCYAFHQYMRCFEGHKVLCIEAFVDNGTDGSNTPEYPLCKEHPPQEIRFYCNSCRAGACASCLASLHVGPTHLTVRMRDAEACCRDDLRRLCDETVRHHTACTRAVDQLKTASAEIEARQESARAAIETAYLAYLEELRKRRDEMLAQLKAVYSQQDLKVIESSYLLECTKDRIQRAIDFTQKLLGLPNPLQVLSLYQMVRMQLCLLLDINAKPDILDADLTFEYDVHRFAEALEVIFGRITSWMPPVSSAPEGLLTPSATPVDALPPPGFFNLPPPLPLTGVNGHSFSNCEAMAAFSRQNSSFPGNCGNDNYPAISAGPDGTSFRAPVLVPAVVSVPPPVIDVRAVGPVDEASEQLSPGSSSGSYNRMQIRLKFGQLGDEEGQFHSPHGFCLGFEEDILVADTNNHRIQVFDQGGNFKFMFGEVGKGDGQLWFPRKVAVLPQSGDVVICDRGSLRSRMQLFSASGAFLRKFAISYMEIVAAVAINRRRNIIVVDSVNPALYEINPDDGVLQTWFSCSHTIREPSDLAVYRDQYYVCDFKGSCVVVFNEAGVCLQRVGNELLSLFPNGIDVSVGGEMLVCSSHGNRFRVTVFSSDGAPIGRYECPHLKISRCCGLKITNEGYILTLAKNNHHVLMLNTIYVL